MEMTAWLWAVVPEDTLKRH